MTAPPARRRALEKLSGLERHLAVLELSVRQADLGPGLRPGLRRPNWPDPVTCERLIDAMTTRELAAILRRRLTPEQRRRAITLILLQGLFTEWKNEMEQHKPDEEILREFFLTRDAKSRDEIMRLPPAEARQRLAEQYAQVHQQQLASLGQRLRKLRNLTGQLWRPPGAGTGRKGGPLRGWFDRERRLGPPGRLRPEGPRRPPGLRQGAGASDIPPRAQRSGTAPPKEP